ncbi:MAG: hypothetical protein GC181_03205 [Bacteroidetes bacterium]|nr:hypothetical protein [Bacteroidota bacterium]
MHFNKIHLSARKIGGKYSLVLKLIFSIGLLNSLNCAGQTIHGIVYEKTSEGLQTVPGAFVHCLNEEEGVVTDSMGHFEIKFCEESHRMVVEHISLLPDTISVSHDKHHYEIILEAGSDILKTAVAEVHRKTYGLDQLNAKTTINIHEREFQKAACCNLSESFENAPAIDVNYGDAVTGTRQIKMLGLDGFYALISREYMPSVRLLNSYYGMSFIPAAWVKGIQITKGVGSVVNGYESLAGQINIELRKPFDHTRFLYDQFVASSGRTETDLMYRHDLSKNAATSFFVRTAILPFRMDRNKDGFMDNPTGRQFQFLNRWQFHGKKWEGEFSAGFNTDHKNAGQQDFYSEDPKQHYGISINNDQLEFLAKVGKVNPDKPWRSFGSQYGFNAHHLKSIYGSSENQTIYQADAKSVYVNLIWQSKINDTRHTYQTGFSFQGDALTETVSGIQRFQFSRQELVPGVFAEYTYKPKEQISIVAGLRSDYNSIYGLSVTPRIHSRFNFNKEKTTLRISGGLGRRTSNILSQNQQVFATNRTFIINSINTDYAYGLNQEVALNGGLSLEHKLKFGLWPATITLDYFRTQFLNEVVMDREEDATVRYYNMKNGTIANSFQAQFDFTFLRRSDLRLAYRMFDVSTKYLEGRMERAMVARNRGFINFTQRTRSHWQFSSTIQMYGRQRLPGKDTSATAITNRWSKEFVMVNLQISKEITSRFEAYLGSENIFNYKQPNPIIGSQNPLTGRFDASVVWGPVFGRMFYAGFRWRINGNNSIKEKEQI